MVGKVQSYLLDEPLFSKSIEKTEKRHPRKQLNLNSLRRIAVT
jgi:hypothetical protein